MTTNRLELIASTDAPWYEAVHGVIAYKWDWNDQVQYLAVRIADAVVTGRSSLESVSQELKEASGLYRGAVALVREVAIDQGSLADLNSLSDDDIGEIYTRGMAYQSLRNGKNRVRTANHRRHHLADYQARVAMLHSTTNMGLGRLEARDLYLDDLWYDRDES